MSSFEERQQEKLERYQELAEKAEQRSEDHWKTAHEIADMIPFGQPILKQQDKFNRNVLSS
ncbi:MAG: DUF3560 domain-containing protein [Theionarchaea archaeon]|nr:DUF3560 domain-containing protein [Theionarchaea archaeon]